MRVEKDADPSDSKPTGWFIVDRHGLIREANQAGATMLGLKRENLLNTRLAQFLEPASRPAYRDVCRSVRETNGRKTCQVTFRKTKTERITVLLTGSIAQSGSVSGANIQLAFSRIAARGPAEQALLEGEERFRLLVEALKDHAIYMLDPEGHVTTWNTGAERIKGYKAEEIIGQHFSCFYPEEDMLRDKPGRMLAAASTAGHSSDQGWQVRKDGTRFWADTAITVLRDERGKLRGFAKVTRDITERKRAKEALSESEGRLQAILDHTPALIFLKDTQGRYLVVNRQFETVFHVNRKDIEGKLDADIFPPEQAAAFRANDLKVLEAGLPLEFEETAIHDDGGHTSIVVKFPLRDAEGKTYAVGGIATDITDRKRATETLKHSEERMRSIVDTAYDAFVAMDDRGLITSWNKQAEAMFGWSREEALGRNMSETIMPPQFQEAHHRGLRRFLATGEGVVINKRLELTALRRDGTEFPIELSVCPQKVGDSLTFNAFIADITERKRAINDLTRSHQQLLELAARLNSVREEERARISREIHDELGQELTGLKLDIAWVRRQVSDASPSLLVKLDSMAQLADATIQSVRHIATELRPAVLDQLGLLPAIEWLTEEFQDRTGIQCKLNFYLRQIRLDKDRATAVFRICQELLTNIARHAMATSVTLSARECAGQLVCEVSDNGKGITEAELSDPKSLGLLGVRQRASLLGGETLITGIRGKGTKVTVTMPLGDQAE